MLSRNCTESFTVLSLIATLQAFADVMTTAMLVATGCARIVEKGYMLCAHVIYIILRISAVADSSASRNREDTYARDL